MKLFLNRNFFLEYGIFGELTCEEFPKFKLYTLEHSYKREDGTFYPKLGIGQYVCKLGEHRLKFMDHTFQTYEITGVLGHTGMLFHVGNYNKDSEGCVLLGSGIDLHSKAIYGSKDGFSKFIDLLGNRTQFDLMVNDVRR